MEKKTPKKTGRPKKEIDKEQFEKLCGFMCTETEIGDWFNCSHDTINRWCHNTYKLSFANAFKKYSSNGKVSLRRYQFALAEKNATMAIFLGKQYLGQSDKVEVESKSIEDLSFLKDMFK